MKSSLSIPPNLRLFPALAKTTSSETAPVLKGEASATDFKQLLAAMVIGFSIPGANGPDNAIGSMMAPLMLSLFEQLMAWQVEDSQIEDGKVEAQSQVVTTPSGKPIEGHLTQASHPGHVALDFGAPVGTPVKATMDGKVVYAGWNDQGYGNLVIIENGPYRTYYAHLSKIPVSLGQNVHAHEVIGLSGNTGNSTGPHLHYEVRVNNQQMNPAGTMDL